MFYGLNNINKLFFLNESENKVSKKKWLEKLAQNSRTS